MIGVFIVVGGIDGSGKSTQAKLLAEALSEENEVLHTFEPTNGVWGKKIRDSFASGQQLTFLEELEAFTNDRIEHVGQTIMPALEAGKIVVCDRFYHSTIAYQGARAGMPQFVDSLRETQRRTFPKPDITFFLDVNPEEALERLKTSRPQINYMEQLPLQKKIRANYLALSVLADSGMQVIHGGDSIETVHNAIWESAKSVITTVQQCGNDQLRRFNSRE